VEAGAEEQSLAAEALIPAWHSAAEKKQLQAVAVSFATGKDAAEPASVGPGVAVVAPVDVKPAVVLIPA
jgi:hypothetical protein